MKRPQIWSWDCGSWFKHVRKLFCDGSQSSQTHLWLLKTRVYWTSLLHHADLQARWYIYIYTWFFALPFFWGMLKTPFPTPLPTQVKPVKLVKSAEALQKARHLLLQPEALWPNRRRLRQVFVGPWHREKITWHGGEMTWKDAMGAVNNWWLVQYNHRIHVWYIC